MFQLSHGENKLDFNTMMIMMMMMMILFKLSELVGFYSITNSSLKRQSGDRYAARLGHIIPDFESPFFALLLLLNAVWLAEKQHIPTCLVFCLPDLDRTYDLQLSCTKS